MARAFPPDFAEHMLHRYLRHWNRKPDTSTVDFEAISWATEEERRERQKKYREVDSDYYDLTSGLLEVGWGEDFHYTPMSPGLSISDSMKKDERDLADMAGLKKGMRVLDHVGCTVVGITNSKWHVERGRALTEQAGLSDQIEFVHGDFLKMPFPDESFDAAYSFEALCYGSVPAEVYSEIQRVLKPGAPFALHDFAMTEKWDVNIPEHRKIRNWIEFGNGITNMPWVPEMRKSIYKAGFELVSEEDLAFRSHPAPWYYAPAGDIWWAWQVPGWADFWKVFKMWSPFRGLVRNFMRFLSYFGLQSKETASLFDMMWFCTKSTAIGAKMGIYTPMYLFLCRKPAKKE